MSKRKQTFEQWLNKENELKDRFFKQLTQEKIIFYGLDGIPSNHPSAQGIGSNYHIMSGVLNDMTYRIKRENFDKLCRDFNSYKHQQKNQGSIRFQAQISKQTFKKFEKIKNDLQIKTTANTLEFLINSLPESGYPKVIDQTQQLLEENRKLRETIQIWKTNISNKDQVRVTKEQLQQQKQREIVGLLFNKLHQTTLNLDLLERLLSERLDCTIDEYLKTIDEGDKEKTSKEIQTRLKLLLNQKIKEIDDKYSLETIHSEQSHVQLPIVGTPPWMPKRPSSPPINQPVITPIEQSNHRVQEQTPVDTSKVSSNESLSISTHESNFNSPSERNSSKNSNPLPRAIAKCLKPGS